MDIANSPLPEMDVEPADVIQGPPEAYKNESTPRGTCFIANWNQFDNGIKERKGSSIDVASLEKLFSQIGYWNVKKVEDLTKQELLSALEDLRDKEISPQHDSFVGIFMSHGKENEIFMRDGELVHVADIYDLFSGDSCPLLVNKPKIFIFQHCRGDRHTSLASQLETDNTDGKEFTQGVGTQGISDTYVVFSTRPRFVSYRNEHTGGAFIVEVCHVLRNHAKNKDICHLISLINSNLSKRESRQLCDLNMIGHKAKFYFNPLGKQSLSNVSSSTKGNLVKDYLPQTNTDAKESGQEAALADSFSRSWHGETPQYISSYFPEDFFHSNQSLENVVEGILQSDFDFDTPENYLSLMECNFTTSSLGSSNYLSSTKDRFIPLSRYPDSFTMPQKCCEAPGGPKECRIYFFNYLHGCKGEVHELSQVLIDLGFQVDHLEDISSLQMLRQNITTLESQHPASVIVFYYGYGYGEYILVGQSDQESISYKHFCNLFALNKSNDFDTVVFTNICFKPKASHTKVIISPKDFVDNTYHLQVKVNGTCENGSLMTKAILEELSKDEQEREFSAFTSCISSRIKCVEECCENIYSTSVWYYGVVRPFYLQFSLKSKDVFWKTTTTPDTVSEESRLLFSETSANERQKEQQPLNQKESGRTLWEFLLLLLCDDEANPSIIQWEDKDLHIFRIVKPVTVAKRWGMRHNMTHYQLRTFSRMIRYYRGKGIMDSVSGEKYVFHCGPKAIERLNELEKSKQECINLDHEHLSS